MLQNSFLLTSSTEAHVPALPWHGSVVLLSPAPFWYLLSSLNVGPAENKNSEIITENATQTMNERDSIR